MLNGCDQFRVAGMEIQIAIADRKDCSATTTNEASRAAKETFRMVRRSPTGISSAADTALLIPVGLLRTILNVSLAARDASFVVVAEQSFRSAMAIWISIPATRN